MELNNILMYVIEWIFGGPRYIVLVRHGKMAIILLSAENLI